MSPNCPSISPAVRVVSVDGGLIAYHTDRDVVHHLNATAAFILALCDGRHEVEEIKAAVLFARSAQPGGAGLDGDVDAWLTGAEADGLVSRNGVATEGANLGEMTADELAGLAERLHDQDETRLAYECQRRATQLEPDNAQLWYDLGEYAHALPDRDAARQAYQKYLQFEPDDAEVAHLLIALNDLPPPPRASDQCVVATFDAFAESYDQRMMEDLGYRAPSLVMDLLRPMLPAPASQFDVADLGCGTGLAGKLLKPWARRLVGVDLSPQMAGRACATGQYDEVHVAELTSWLAAVERRFDLMVSCDVLIYFGDLMELLTGAAAALAPGGWLGVSLERFEGDGYRITDSGRYAHSEAYLRETAAAAGLRIVATAEAVIRTEYAQPVMGLLAVLRHTQAQS